jgi:hypothetical protein
MADQHETSRPAGPKPDKPPKPDKSVEIIIDSERFAVRKEKMTAEELRALPDPDIGADRDLYLEGHGDRDDDLIEAGETVRIKKGLRFFTAPATITPGRAA